MKKIFLPCPFCGCEEILIQNSVYSKEFIMALCNNCGTSSREVHQSWVGEEFLFSLWNTRKTDSTSGLWTNGGMRSPCDECGLERVHNFKKITVEIPEPKIIEVSHPEGCPFDDNYWCDLRECGTKQIDCPSGTTGNVPSECPLNKGSVLIKRKKEVE